MGSYLDTITSDEYVELYEQDRGAWFDMDVGQQGRFGGPRPFSDKWNQLAGYRFMKEQRDAYEEAKADAEADREDILGELEAWRAGLNEDYVEQGVSSERAAWDQRIAAAQDRLIQNAAAQGKALSPWLQQEVLSRLASQANEAIALRRMQLDRDRSERSMQYIQAKDSVYANTQREMIDPGQSYELMSRLGSG